MLKSSLGAMTVAATGELTLTIQSERVTHIMESVLAEWAFVVYLKDEQGNFLFTAPYAIESFASEQIELVPNKEYPRAEERPDLKIQKFDKGHNLVDSLRNKMLDVGFHLPIDTLPELRKTENVRIKSFEVGYHYMMFYNMDTLTDLRVRKAIDLAIDRNALSQALAGGTGTRSLFPDYTAFFSEPSDVHGDMEAAEALLEETGWALNANDKRVDGDGLPLTVNLVAYLHRPGLVIMQPVIAEALTSLGIDATQTVTTQKWTTTQQIIDNGIFDLLLWAQHTMPAGDPVWLLSTFFRSDGASNHANIESANVDSHLKELSDTEVHGNRVLLAQAAQKAILDEVPVSNLVTPFWHIGLSDRMADYRPWGSDYYVVRADLFLEGTDTEVQPTEAVVKDSGGSSLIASHDCLGGVVACFPHPVGRILLVIPYWR